jgi:hypothetical protein
MITKTNNDQKDKQWSQRQTMITKTNNDHKDKQWSTNVYNTLER